MRLCSVVSTAAILIIRPLGAQPAPQPKPLTFDAASIKRAESVAAAPGDSAKTVARKQPGSDSPGSSDPLPQYSGGHSG